MESLVNRLQIAADNAGYPKNELYLEALEKINEQEKTIRSFRKRINIRHSFQTDAGSEFCKICGQSVIGHP